MLLLSPEHIVRSAALAATSPPVPTLGTLIVKEPTSEQPPAFVTVTVTTDSCVIALVINCLSALN